MAAFNPGDKVFADVGDGKLVGFVLSGPHGDEDKYTVQVGVEKHQLGYREPADRDDSGSGLTFWSI